MKLLRSILNGKVVVWGGFFAGCIYWFNSQCYPVPLDLIVFFHLCFITIGVLLFGTANCFDALCSFLKTLALWIVIVLVARGTSDRPVMGIIDVEARSMRSLASNFWTASRGRILLRHPSVENEFDALVKVQNFEGNLDLQEFEELLEASLNRPFRLSYREQYLDLCFRPVGVLIEPI